VNASLISGLNNPQGIAIFGSDLFVVNTGSSTIGEYLPDGTTVNADLLSGLNSPYGIAVVPEPSVVALMGSGVVALGLWRRRK
jgi:hypothetical protein